MSGFKVNIEKKTVVNKYYRKVIYTTPQTQLVLMSLPPSDDIPLETHKSTTQFIRVEKGHGYALIANKHYSLSDGDAIIIPPDTQHYIKNTGKQPLKLYTLYSPPEHDPNTLQKTHPRV